MRGTVSATVSALRDRLRTQLADLKMPGRSKPWTAFCTRSMAGSPGPPPR